MKIIIGAVISVPPYAPGFAWHWLQYAAGFQQLGHEVFYLEEVAPAWCIDEAGRPCDFAHSINRRLFQASMKRVGLMDRACQIYDHGQATFGLSRASLERLAKEADLLINMSGHIKTLFILDNVKRRVYVDQDPVYTQLWYAEYGQDVNFGQHDLFFSVGLNIGTPYTPIPDCGLNWHHTLPPVVLEHWPFAINPSSSRFTTIASWGGHGDLQYRGEWYRSKYAEFRRFAELPGQAKQEFEIALRRHREDDPGVQLLRANGWFLREAIQIADLDAYLGYIQESRAEIGIAKHAYVKGCSGWFSDRAAHYLASGKPVLAQATGFERHVPTGQGLLTFVSVEEAVTGVEEINRNYATHCRAARSFAAEYLDYRVTLPKMLEICAV
jgi:hypothetical protein